MTGPDEIDALKRRLVAAERVCYLYGISVIQGRTEREKACAQAWQAWSGPYWQDCPRVSDDEVAELAAQRDAIREAALARLRDDQ